ncbi:hypothetical protein [Mycobacterium sp. 3519A]|uniref:hypothetical protein n=1 Tax=Mycobacterium sp. 3519A TaxID=2057184 RepID=UPI000C7999E9|nr:hypothetical protein [Mycobacterium sp. 3519A]
MNRITLPAAVLAAGAALVFGAGAAQADTFSAQPHSWCPGEALPFNNIQWDMKMCHTWYTVPFGQGNVRMVDLQGNPLDSFISADIPAPEFPMPPPLPTKPPGTPFCSPRGALIIIPPICDEIGVQWP